MTKQPNNYKISQSIFNRDNRLLATACLLSSLMAACGFQSYQAKPIVPEQKQTQYLARTPDSESFTQFLISQHYPGEDIPIQQWGLHELTLCALFFHPDLALSRAEWRAAMAEQASASQRPELGVSTDIAHHSKTDGNISPWTLGLGIDVPIETAGKREVRIDRARQLSEAARLQIGQTAWQVRSRLARSFVDFQYATLQIDALEKELVFRKSIVAMLEKRLAAGMASSIEVLNMRLALQKTQQQWSLQTSHLEELEANLAGDAGLPLSSFKRLNLATKDIHHLTDSTSLPSLENEQAQQMALLNRLDIRAALARYEAAEAKLRLEIARQYPNITLSPSYTYDQNDHVWSLGLSSLLTLIQKNRGLIEEARALREVEAAKFEVLQINVINELAQKEAGYLAAKAALEQAQNYSQSLQVRTEKTQRQFAQGLTDRLELTSTQLENITTLQNVINTAYQLEIAGIDLENVMQRPIDAKSAAVNDNIEAANLEQTITPQ